MMYIICSRLILIKGKEVTTNAIGTLLAFEISLNAGPMIDMGEAIPTLKLNFVFRTSFMGIPSRCFSSSFRQ
jgi:hypothetical protein